MRAMLFFVFTLMRLDKFVCKSTQLTPLEAIAAIAAARVSINGVIVTNELAQAHANNTVMLDGVTLITRDFRYILLHKPAGTICSNVDEAYPSVFTYLPIEKQSELHIAGRLDADTTGMVLITDDGHWSFNITSPQKKCSKVYRVDLCYPLNSNVVAMFEQGIKLAGETQLTAPARLEMQTPQQVLLTLTEGKFHQVKRMFAAVGNRVISLHREKIGAVALDIDVGHWRNLTEQEVCSFYS